MGCEENDRIDLFVCFFRGTGDPGRVGWMSLWMNEFPEGRG